MPEQLIQTPSQTVGPFFAIGLPWEDGPDVVPPDTPGAFWIRGILLDGAGAPVPDALIETWQADPQGRFDHHADPRGRVEGFRGFARSSADAEGRWAIRTVKPGSVPYVDGRPQAPHLAVSILSRGLLDRVTTRIYFADEEAANAADPILAQVPETRRGTLLAHPDADGGYSLDFRIQGEGETVFFAV
jgi:protocatechuate 3,4-dioxygenase, alpha subunit